MSNDNSQTLKVLQAALLRPVAGLGLTKDICTSLHASEIWYVFDLMQTTESELLDKPDIDLESVNDIRGKLLGLGLGLANHPNDALVAQAIELLQEKLSQPIGPPYKNAELELTVKAHNDLHANGIYSIGDLIKLTEFEFFRLHNFGRSANKVLEELSKKGYSLREGKPAKRESAKREDWQKLIPSNKGFFLSVVLVVLCLLAVRGCFS